MIHCVSQVLMGSYQKGGFILAGLGAQSSRPLWRRKGQCYRERLGACRASPALGGAEERWASGAGQTRKREDGGGQRREAVTPERRGAKRNLGGGVKKDRPFCHLTSQQTLNRSISPTWEVSYTYTVCPFPSSPPRNSSASFGKNTGLPTRSFNRGALTSWHKVLSFEAYDVLCRKHLYLKSLNRKTAGLNNKQARCH